MSKKDTHTIQKAKGRPMLTWQGKHPLERVEYYPAQEKEVYGKKDVKDFNKLFWGDNLQVLSHLLKKYRGKIDLIYIDPPFDSKANYVKKVKIRGQKVEGEQQNLLEEKQYTDIWENDEYLQFMYERLQIMRELLADTGSIYLHCDWHKGAFLKLVMDEVFGEGNFRNEIIWKYVKFQMRKMKRFAINTDKLLWYTKTSSYMFNPQTFKLNKPKYLLKKGWNKERGIIENIKNKDGKTQKIRIDEEKVDDVWSIPFIGATSGERMDYPTQKPEKLLERVLDSSTQKGDLVLDCFCGSGTTLAVAQKLGRKWIGCDINIGAIQTTTKRLGQIIDEQIKSNGNKNRNRSFDFAQDGTERRFKGLLAFKVLNVNDYDIFKNELEAKDIVMDMYGVEPVKRSYFDGFLDNNFVKVLPLNRVLNKLDIKTVLKNVEDGIDNFTVKTTTKQDEELYQEGVIIICSGAELDADDFLKKENKTGVKVSIRNILNDKKHLIFKKKPEAKVEVKTKGKVLTIEIKDFHSPILMRKLQLENEKALDKKSQAKVEDFRQIVDSVAIDVNYNGKLFNTEIIDLPNKKELIKAKYQHTYKQAGKEVVAVKIVDVLGEKYFETFEVKI
ncbi:site-specific DNA-methyltransferase [Patescibacteria group bacterium]|nr:site-specific DNA-methyltransferase [Patescibacteria group bacterium]